MSSQNETKLSTQEKVGYGLGDTASNIFFFGVNAWIFFYYTEVCKIPAATVGTLLLVPRLWDAITDPLMGALADPDLELIAHTCSGLLYPLDSLAF